MAIDLPIAENPYQRKIGGVYGEFGAGGNVQAFYLQSALTAQQLKEWVSLISEIEGSEAWHVRDLFQRDVDTDRVTRGLLPYLSEPGRIKFFNPLTLTILPMELGNHAIQTPMPEVEEGTVDLEGRRWHCLEREDYYRVRWIDTHPEFAALDLSESRCRLVAIDGQHRLSALKRMLRDPGTPAYQDLMGWRIPVVIVSFRSLRPERTPPNVLEVVRSIFVNINKEAKEINRAREILLSDNSINAVFTQQLLDRSHRNDLLPPEQRDPACLPLLCYDWRGEERGGERVPAPAAIKSIEELYDWFDYYILDEDFSDYQKAILGVTPTHPLHEAFHDRKLGHEASNEVRQSCEEILNAVSFVLQNFAPYRSYVAALRELEQRYVYDPDASDLAHHAFYQLRFGTSRASDAERKQVDELLEGIRNDVEKKKREFLPELIQLDIGMRGVISAFGKIYDVFSDMNWDAYAEWFVQTLNCVYGDGWLDFDTTRTKFHYQSRIRGRRHKLVRHVAQNHEEAVTNYRLDQVDAGLGAFVELLVCVYGTPLPALSDEDWSERRSILVDTLRNTVLRGYRKEVRPDLREDHPNGGKALTDAVNKLAGRLADEHIRQLERALERAESLQA